MATTSSLGIGTGVDLQSMLAKLMAVERNPITVLDAKISAANSKISVYGTLKSKLDALQSAADTLQFPSRLSAMTAVSSDSAVLGASANFNATVGSYATEVTQLASAQKSFSVAYAAGSTFGPGDLNFTVGGVAAAAITFDPGSYTLEEVGARINSASIGVTANVVTTSTGEQRMILTGDQTGAGNDFQLSSTLTASGGQESLANFDVATLGLNRATAQDATMTLDGIEVSSSTNTFSGAISGLTLTAIKLGPSTVTIKNDETKIISAVQTFVDSYNAVATFIKSNSGYDAATKISKAFSGDATVRSVMGALGDARSTIPAELSSAALQSLSALGVTIQQTGLLSLDTAALTTAIGTSASDVTKAVNAYGKSFSNAIQDMLGSSGAVANRVESLNSSVKRYEDNQSALEVRVAMIEKRYRAQFTALDVLVSSMQTTSSYLAQTLAKL